MRRIAVIGIGNVLTGDDAVGPHVAKVLEAEWTFAPDVTVMDAGTPGYDLTAFIADADAVVLVDSVRAKGPPGEVRVYDKAQLLSKAPVRATSPHEPGVREALLNADFMGVCPEVVRLVGVIPESTATGIGLSPAVRAAMPAAVEKVVEELRALGVEATRRDPPAKPDLWWEKAPDRS